MSNPTEIPSPEVALDEAARAVGNRTQLARRLGLTKAAVYNWRRVPVRWVLSVERESGVPRTALRPDVYPS